MPSADRKQAQPSGIDYGAAVAGENVDFAQDAHTEPPGTRDKALLDRLKDALRPADARRPSVEARHSGDATHDGRYGGVEGVMRSGNRDYEEPEEVPRAGLLDELGQRTPVHERKEHGSIFDNMKFGHSKSQEEPKSGGLMDAIRRKSDSGRHEEHRDSSHLKKSDEHHFPGGTYRTIRDELSK